MVVWLDDCMYRCCLDTVGCMDGWVGAARQRRLVVGSLGTWTRHSLALGDAVAHMHVGGCRLL